VFITTLLIPLFIWLSSGAERLWWLGLATLWGFTLALLCTVGRPMDRYLLPVLPIMFWSLSHGLFLLCDSTANFLRKRSTPADQRSGHVAA
jgi:hypothetical protein